MKILLIVNAKDLILLSQQNEIHLKSYVSKGAESHSFQVRQDGRKNYLLL